MELHLHTEYIGRSRGGSVTEKVDYVLRQGKSVNKPDKVVEVFQLNMPTWAESSNHFWRALEKRTTRKNAMLAFYGDIAFPRELNVEACVQLARRYLSYVCVFSAQGAYGGAVTCTAAIHEGKAGGGSAAGNMHLHVVFSTTINDGVSRTETQYFARANRKKMSSSGAPRSRNMGTKPWLKHLRETFAAMCNSMLASHAPLASRVEHLSYKRRGVVRIPKIHVGAYETQLHRSGKFSFRFWVNQQIEKMNMHLKRRQWGLKMREIELKDMQRSIDERRRYLEKVAQEMKLFTDKLIVGQQIDREGPMGIVFFDDESSIDDDYPDIDQAQAHCSRLNQMHREWVFAVAGARLVGVNSLDGAALLMGPSTLALRVDERHKVPDADSRERSILKTFSLCWDELGRPKNKRFTALRSKAGDIADMIRRVQGGLPIQTVLRGEDLEGSIPGSHTSPPLNRGETGPSNLPRLRP